ncbi:MAG: hypothetical protein ACRCUJ_07780 [Phocaeicola sp.]
MKAIAIETKSFREGAFEARVNALVKYNSKSYAVSVTCYFDFKDGEAFIKNINSFKYLSTISRSSIDRDNAIKRILKGIKYEFPDSNK